MARAKLTVIVGTAGSGKTTLLKKIVRENAGVYGFSDATLASCDRKRAGFKCLGEIVARLLGEQVHCVIDESHLTVASFRDLFKRFCDELLTDVEVEWIFIKNDTLACINNVYSDYITGRRDEHSRYRALLEQSQQYSPPTDGEWPNSKIIEVEEQDDPRFTDEGSALAWLNEMVKNA